MFAEDFYTRREEGISEELFISHENRGYSVLVGVFLMVYFLINILYLSKSFFAV